MWGAASTQAGVMVLPAYSVVKEQLHYDTTLRAHVSQVKNRKILAGDCQDTLVCPCGSGKPDGKRSGRAATIGGAPCPLLTRALVEPPPALLYLVKCPDPLSGVSFTS